MEDCILSPTKTHQHLDYLQDYIWRQQLLSSSAIDAATTLSPGDLLLNKYNPLVYNFEDWSILNDVEFGFMPGTLPSLSSPLELGPESPISSSSSTSADDLFDDTGIDPNVLSCHLYNRPATPCRESLLDFPDLQTWKDSQSESNQTSIGHRVLSPSEIQELYAIAMPALAPSLHGSDFTSSPEPDLEIEAQKRKRHKPQQPAKSNAKPLTSKHQTAHNLIEKKYRNNINNKIADLRDCVPSLRVATKENYGDRDSAESGLGGQNESQKLNKATILSKAVEYISHLEKLTESIREENTTLRSKVTALEGLILPLGKRKRWNPEAEVQMISSIAA